MKLLLKKTTLILMVLLIISSTCFSAVPVSSQEPEESLADYVNTLFGVGSSTSAGPSLPNGSIHPSPETRTCDNGGYSKGKPVVGFGQLYAQGTGGNQSYGNFLLAPMTGNLVVDDAARASSISAEQATCYYYTAKLDSYNIKAEVAPAHNSAIYKFTYPAGSEKVLLLNAGRKISGSNAMENGRVTIDKTNHIISGGGLFSGNWNPASWNMYFAMQYDTDSTEVGTIIGDTQAPLSSGQNIKTVSTYSKQNIGAYLKFGTSGSQQEVKVKIAISFKSEAQAKSLLNEQIPGYDFEQVKSDAKDIWEEELSKITVDSSVDNYTKTKFYTALYHTNIQPRDRLSDSGNWDDYYTIWDSWKTAFPLQTLINPEKIASKLNSFITRAKNGGIMSDAFIQGKDYVCGQGGNDIENIIADAYIKNIPGVNWNDAYEVVKNEAETFRTKEYIDDGYVYGSTRTANGLYSYSNRLKPASATMAFAYNDYAVSLMAKGLGLTEDYNFYLDRSRNWVNVWDPNVQSDGYSGFAHNKNSDGTFNSFDPKKGYNTDFYESTSWDGSYTNNYDLDKMIELMGGRAAFIQRLKHACESSKNYSNDDGGREGYLNFTNEPSFQIPWLFSTDQIKRPDLTAETVNRILTRFTNNNYPGDEDNGAMSSYYIFMMSGFFPYSTTNNYYLHGSHLPKVTFKLSNGKSFVISSENLGENNIYVQSATLNGRSYDECKITYEQIMDGGELHFVMGNTASDWAELEDTNPPAAVENLRADANSALDGETNLSWNLAYDVEDNVKNYEIYRGDNIGFICDQNSYVTSVTETSFIEKQTTIKHCWYKIITADEGGNKSEPAVVRVVLNNDNDSPTKVENISADAGLLAQGIINLSWNPSTDNKGIETYQIYRGTAADFTISENNLVGRQNNTSFFDVRSIGTYYYKVIARDSSGNVSPVSNVYQVNVSVEPSVIYTDNVNHAEYKTATTNGYNNNDQTGASALDGSNSTKWCVKDEATGNNAKAPHVLEVNLESPTVINRYVVRHAGSGGESQNLNTGEFKLQYTDENGDWVDGDVVTDNTANVTDRTIPTIITSKVRLYITKAVAKSSESNTARIYEFELYSPPNPTSELDYEGSLMNYNGVTLSANNEATNTETAANVKDKNESTKWSARFQYADNTVVAPSGAEAFTNGVSWLKVDLGREYSVDKLYYVGSEEEREIYRTKELYLQSSTDGVEWSYIPEGAWKDTEEYQVPNKLTHYFSNDITARYFRLVLPIRGNNNDEKGPTNARVREFHLFDSSASVSHDITAAPIEGAQAELSSVSSSVGKTVTVDVNYSNPDRSFKSIAVVGESGTPVTVNRIGNELKFRFTMPNEPVNITVHSNATENLDREAIEAAIYALKDGIIEIPCNTSSLLIYNTVKNNFDGLMLTAPYADGVSAILNSTFKNVEFIAHLSKGNEEATVNIKSLLRGDVSEDGIVNIKDLVRFKKYACDSLGTATFFEAAADCDRNGIIETGIDMVTLKKYLIGSIMVF